MQFSAATSDNVMKNILKTLTKDLKSTVPSLTGKEYKFDFCKDTLILAGYRINVETTEICYMGEVIKDIKALNINFVLRYDVSYIFQHTYTINSSDNNSRSKWQFG